MKYIFLLIFSISLIITGFLCIIYYISYSKKIDSEINELNKKEIENGTWGKWIRW